MKEGMPMTATNTKNPSKLSRRRLLALPAAGIAAALPASIAAAGAEPSPLDALIDRHRAAARAFDDACLRLDQVERTIGEKYPADVCRDWMRAAAPARKQWLKVRKAHGVDELERERLSLDRVEKDIALELLACPCRTIEEVRAKAGYVRQAEIIRENLLRDEGFVEALLQSLG
jgi:hypothetical protein